MGKKTKIIFKNKVYLGFESLVIDNNKNKTDFFKTTTRSVDERFRKWKRKNPGKKINDNEIKKILIPRRASSFVLYKRKYFTPTELYKILKIKEITFKGFHRNLKKWQNENEGRNPTTKQIENFAIPDLIKTKDGRFIGRTRQIYESLEKPKIVLPVVPQRRHFL